MAGAHPCSWHVHGGSRHVRHCAVRYAVGHVALIRWRRRHLVLECTKFILVSFVKFLLAEAASLAVGTRLMCATMPKIGVST